MKRIDIQWNTEKVCVTDKDVETSGVVTIWEGKKMGNVMSDMQPTHSFKATKSNYSTRLSQIDNNPLPELTDMENDILHTMISSFYSGLTKDGYCSHWLERA